LMRTVMCIRFARASPKFASAIPTEIEFVIYS
jgi:hypothetical protein